MTEIIRPYRVDPPPGPPRVGICGGCRVPSLTGLMILVRHGVPPGEPGHGVEFYEWVLQCCGGCGAAVLHRRVHDCFGAIEDETDHWLLPAEDAARLRALIAGECPAPLEPTCACPLHLSLLASCRELPGARPERVSRIVLTVPPAGFVQTTPEH